MNAILTWPGQSWGRFSSPVSSSAPAEAAASAASPGGNRLLLPPLPQVGHTLLEASPDGEGESEAWEEGGREVQFSVAYAG